MVGTGRGASLLWRYALTPGMEALSTPQWPADSTLRLRADAPTLVVFLHPQCPCSRATVRELAEILQAGCNVHHAQVVVYKPSRTDSSWEHTDLWEAAAQISGVSLSVDWDGCEAKRFSATTSGHAMLYSPEGRLLFSGGITYARGHEGTSEGRAALLSLVGDEHSIKQTPVFGCPF